MTKPVLSLAVVVGLVTGGVCAGFNFGMSGAVKNKREQVDKEVRKRITPPYEEDVSAPTVLTGTTIGLTRVLYSYATGGSSTDRGHPVEYRFDWGDGTYSTWSATPSDMHSWSSSGIKLVRAQARCQIHIGFVTTSVVALSVTMAPAIWSVAGTGANSYNGDGIDAAAADLRNPVAVAVDGSGNIFIADMGNNRIRKVDVITGLISTVAGTGTGGYNGDGIDATMAMLSGPGDVVVDNSGDLWIADTMNHRIRKVDAVTGLISTVAGTGTPGYNMDGIAATAADLDTPYDLALDSSGNLFIADFGNHRVRKVHASSGLISTMAGTGVPGYSGDGVAATMAALNGPSGVAVDGAGNVFVADRFNNRIRRVHASSGMISTAAGKGSGGYSGDGGFAIVAELFWPYDVSVDNSGALYIADNAYSIVRRVDGVTEKISTFAGTGLGTYNGDKIDPATATLFGPRGVYAHTSGAVLIADTLNHRIRQVDP